MADVKVIAKKRRAKLLSEFIKTGWSKRRFAISKGISAARIGKLLEKASQEKA
jgi:hypothetical protein